MATCSPSQLLAISSEFDLQPALLLQIQTSLLCQILQQSNPMADCSVQSLLTSSNCFGCLTIPQLYIIQTQLLCEILHAGGGGGQSCLTCSIDTDPVDPPLCDCAIHYRKDISKFWYWDAETAGGTWFPFIGA